MPKSIDDVDFDAKMFCLFKGDPGTAKSPAAASFPEPYIFDLEGRIGSVANYWRGKKKIYYDTYINNYPAMMNMFEALMVSNSYGTIIMDGFTLLSRSLMHLSLGSRPDNPAPARGGKVRTYNNIGAKGDFKGIMKPEIDDWYTESNGIIQVIDAMRALWNGGKGCNCICIGHVIETTKEDIAGNQTSTRRMMTGGNKIGAEIPIYFNEAYHFYCRTLVNRTYEAITKNVGEDWAKTILPISEKIDFTNKSLYDEIRRQIADYKIMQNAKSKLV